MSVGGLQEQAGSNFLLGRTLGQEKVQSGVVVGRAQQRQVQVRKVSMCSLGRMAGPLVTSFLLR